MSTLSTLTDEILLELEGSADPTEITTLASDIATTTETTIYASSESGGLRAGATVQIDDELMRVLDRNGSEVTVVRGWSGTTAATHSDGSIVYVNPRWTRLNIYNVAKREVISWPRSIFAVTSVDITVNYSSDVMAFDLGITAAEAALVRRILHVERQNTETKRWEDVRRWDVLINQDAAVFPSTMALQLWRKVPNYTTYRVHYGTGFDVSTWTAGTDLIATAGLTAQMENILTYGVMARLLAPKESKRSQGQRRTQSQRAASLRAGHQAQTATYFQSLRERELKELSSWLLQQWPIRRTV